VTRGEIQVRDAFLAALMLTGTIQAAEQAVSNAIATSRCGVVVEELLVATAECAVQLRGGGSPGAGIPSTLPPELRRLFSLSSVDRQCFVLRMLMGLTPEATSGMLNLHREEVDEALCRAVRDLPRGEQISGEQNGEQN
jgi:hypothetical protein